ncbi:MAG TPA: TonB-dependent receptor, partial [Bacteroidota bacterium]
MKHFRPILLLTVFFALAHNLLLGQGSSKGIITGSVVDFETGEAILGANVILEGTTIGAATDLNGTYVMRADPGSYTLVVSVISYAKRTITDVRVVAGETTTIDAVMTPESIETDEVVVTARMIQNTEATTLLARQRSVAVSDAISIELVSRAGGSTAADAMTKVTGASVVGGKYVFIRGLGERYTSTHLNGTELPSADPDKRTFQMDLFPSTLLQNIVTVKSFTPDRPGNFSGGIVDLGTTSYPERFFLKISSSSAYSSGSSFSNNFLTYAGGANDWLAMDDGTRALPSLLADPNVRIPDATTARNNPAEAEYLDQASLAFVSQMAPTKKTAPLNQKYSLAIGDQISVFGSPLGFLASASYAREFTFYDQGTIGRWKLTGSVESNDELTRLIDLKDSRGMDEVSLGGLFTVSMKLDPSNEFSGNVVYTRTGESVARYMIGEWPEQLTGSARFETRVLQFTQRDLLNAQLRGKHVLAMLANSTIEWSATRAASMQDEPDSRYFSNTISRTTLGGQDTTVYSISPSLFPRPARYFRNLLEKTSGAAVELSIPFSPWNGLHARVKSGWSLQEKGRTFNERRFEYRQAPGTVYAGDPEQFFSESNTGIIGYDSARGRYIFGNYIANAPDARGGNYDGYERVGAVFGMVELPLSSVLRLVGGVRYEVAHMNIAGRDTVGTLDDRDLLPSLSIIYQLSPTMNIRTSYGKTLARPNFREKAPYASYSFANDFVFIGNVSLQRTLIDNYDIRWEWFVRPGEIFAVSAFYKSFKNPIERVINVLFASEGGEVLYANVGRARVSGLEFEIRTSLGDMHPLMENFGIGGNLSIISSAVNIPAEEL